MFPFISRVLLLLCNNFSSAFTIRMANLTLEHKASLATTCFQVIVFWMQEHPGVSRHLRVHLGEEQS